MDFEFNFVLLRDAIVFYDALMGTKSNYPKQKVDRKRAPALSSNVTGESYHYGASHDQK